MIRNVHSEIRKEADTSSQRTRTKVLLHALKRIEKGCQQLRAALIAQTSKDLPKREEVPARDASVWASAVFLAMTSAGEKGDIKLMYRYKEWLENLVTLQGLLFGFHNSYGGRLEGKNGVKEILDVSHQTVYSRLKSLGLSAAQFRKPRVTLETLILESPLLRPALMEVLKQPATKHA